jgi:peptidoglycan/LPS O-acetylase OafA/YrhL
MRFDALTGIRAIAASLVFIYHNRKYWRAQLHPEVLRLVNEFHIGVSLFFVLSGFLIAYTYSTKPSESPNNYFKYIILRCARILPLYWIILIALSLDPKFAQLKQPALTASLLHGFSNKLNLNGLAQAWSLNVEMTFYILAPFLCLLQRKSFLQLLLALISLLVIALGVGQLLVLYNGNPLQFFTPLKFVLGSTFPGRFTEFLAGMILASAIKQNQSWTHKTNKTLIGSIGIMVTAYTIGLFQPDIFHHGTDHVVGWGLHTFILPIFITLLLAGLINEQTKLQTILKSKLFILLGNASFAFYLIHISYVNIRLKWFYLGPDRNFILLWLISIILYLIVEKNLYELCKKWINRD